MIDGSCYTAQASQQILTGGGGGPSYYGGGGGGGGGGAVPPREQADPVAICQAKAIAKGLANGGLDLLGLIPGESAAAIIVRLVAIDIQGTTGVLGGNAATASLAGSSFGIELGRANFAAPGVKSTLGSAGKAIARGLPVLGWAITAVSVGKDALDAYREYQKCTKAH